MPIAALPQFDWKELVCSSTSQKTPNWDGFFQAEYYNITKVTGHVPFPFVLTPCLSVTMILSLTISMQSSRFTLSRSKLLKISFCSCICSCMFLKMSSHQRRNTYVGSCSWFLHASVAHEFIFMTRLHQKACPICTTKFNAPLDLIGTTFLGISSLHRQSNMKTFQDCVQQITSPHKVRLLPKFSGKKRVLCHDTVGWQPWKHFWFFLLGHC